MPRKLSLTIFVPRNIVAMDMATMFPGMYIMNS